MKRRTFLQGIGVAAALLPSGVATLFAGISDQEKPEKTNDLLRLFVDKADKNIPRLLRRQGTNSDSSFYGGISDEHGLYGVPATSVAIVWMAAGLLSPESSYHRSGEVEERLNIAIDFILREQHEDGAIDLHVTNFHSPPDTAFVVKLLAVVLKYVRTAAPDKLPHFQKVCSKFLTRAGRLLVRGGVHTPNHRWVVCSALARINDLLPDNRYVKRIDQWLAEGIDIDSDGLYTERSAIYSPTVNRSLITVARLLDRKELYVPVRRNMLSSMYLFHANGEPVTDISIRQDRNTRMASTHFYYQYRYMAQLDGDGSFSAMARFIEASLSRDEMADAVMPFFWDDREKLAPLPPADPLPLKYDKLFPTAKIARIRDGGTDASILAGSTTLFSMWKGDAVLQAVRMSTSFFGKGQIKPAELRKEKEGYVLTQRLTAGYYQPLPPELARNDGDWRKMPKSLRKKTELQELIAKVLVRLENGRFSLRFDVRGTDDVPIVIELAFRGDGRLSGVIPADGLSNSYFIGKDGGSYQVGDHAIRFSHGPNDHKLLRPRFTAAPMGEQRVYITGCTPFDYELTIS